MPDPPSLVVTDSVLTLLTIQSEFWYSRHISCLNSVLRPREYTDISDWVWLTVIFVPSFSFVISMPRRAIQKIARTLIIEHSSKSPGADSKNGDIINVTKMSPVIHGKAAVNGDLW